MITLNATQQAIIAAGAQEISWLWEVTPISPIGGTSTFYWSTKIKTFSGQPYTATIIPASFDGVVETRSRSEYGIQAPNELKFDIKYDQQYASAFKDATVVLKLVVLAGVDSEETAPYLQEIFPDEAFPIEQWPFVGAVSTVDHEEIIRSYKFVVKDCYAEYGRLKFNCVDFVQRYLEGTYPNTPLTSELFPSTESGNNDNMCVPVTFGTCYIPLRCIYAGTSRYYLLGPVTGHAYTISAVRSPDEWAGVSEWDNTYTFTQSTQNDVDGNPWRVFQPIIADSDSDGVEDACGLWYDNGRFLDMPTQFSDSATASITNFADLIAYVLEDMGIAAADIDTGAGSSFETAAATFDSWGLTCNGAFYYKEDRRKVLSRLLNMCHATLVIRDKIQLRVLSKTSRQTVTSAHILRKADTPGPGSFVTAPMAVSENDSGYVSFAPANKPQSKLQKAKVAIGVAANNIASENLIVDFVQDSADVRKIGVLYYQRKFLKEANKTFSAKPNLLALEPDDMITVSGDNYGGTYPVLIDEIRINPNTSMEFKCIKFKSDLYDWTDLADTPLSFADEETLSPWTPVVAGPDSSNLSNRVPGRLWVGDSILLDSNRFDGAGAIQVGSLLLHDEPFNIHDKLYWDHTLEALFARNLWVSGELHASVMAIDEVHANAGTLLLSASGVLSQDVTTPSTIEDRFIISINEQTTGDYSFMAVGDFLQMKISSPTGINEAWMQVEGHLWDLLDDDCTTLTGWDLAGTNGGSVTAVTFQNRSCFELDSGTSGFYSASALKALAPFGSTLVIDFDVYFDNIGVQASEPFNLDVYSSAADQELIVSFASDGIFVFRTSQYIQVATGIVQMDTWQHYTVEVDWIGKTVDISLDGNLVVHGADFDYSYPTVTDRMRFLQKGSASTRSISYIDRARASTVLMEAENEFPVTLKYGSTDTVFSEGTAVVNWGSSTDRKMLLTSDMAHSPYLDIFTTGETPWEGVTTTTRLGNLAGIIDADFGGALSGEGLYSDNVYLKGMVQITGGSGATNLDDLGTAVADAIPDDVLQSGDSIANLEWDQTYLTGQLVASPIISGNLGYFSGLFQVGSEGIIIDGANKLIRSANYDAGVSGWLIDNDGNAEFNQLVFPERPVSYQSLIDNGDFAQWNSSTDASSWAKSGTGNLQQGSGNYAKIGSYSAKVTTSGADGGYTHIYQRIHSERGIEYWRGRTITVGCWMLFSGAGDSARLIVRDDIHNASKYHPGDGEWHWLTVTFTVDQSATYIQVYPYIQSTFGSVEAMYVDGVTAVEGEECPFYVNKGVSASSGTGLVVNGYRMGFVSNGTWQTYIQNNGSFRFGGNANNYIAWDGTDYTFNTNGLITIQSGGDIKLRGSDTDPGSLIFATSGGSERVEMGLDAAGANLYINPIADGVGDLYVGSAEVLPPWRSGGSHRRHNHVYIYARSGVQLVSYYNGSHLAGVSAYSDSSQANVTMQAGSSLLGGFIRILDTFLPQISLRGFIQDGVHNIARINAGVYTGTGQSTTQTIRYTDLDGLSAFTPKFIFIMFPDDYAHNSPAYQIIWMYPWNNLSYWNGRMYTDFITNVTATSFRIGSFGNISGRLYSVLIMG